ncbi:DUF4031 domain-containing protein [Streptosporangium sp. NPDC050855]|uniref:DUF4031 domain-containing protein n=1 Tax=Streptosporangium sp. NPDC050855 TaxID=3366194 RepID=UPI00379A1B8D
MTIYVDDWRQKARIGRISGRWSHLFSDTCDEELHALATGIGLRRSWFQKADNPLQTYRHYDVTESLRIKAIEAGAVAITWRDMAALIQTERDRRQATAAGKPAPVHNQVRNGDDHDR